MIEIKPGDRVTHKIYGDGSVNNIVPAHGLVWAEVKFDEKPKTKYKREDGLMAIPVEYFRRIDS